MTHGLSLVDTSRNRPDSIGFSNRGDIIYDLSEYNNLSMNI